jgi:hypothetical protein
MEPVSFIVYDEDGNPHEYTVRKHPATEGRMIALRLLGLGIEPLAGLLVPMALAAVRGGGASSAITVDGLAQAVASLPAMISQIDAPLIDAILKHTNRDGVPLMMRPGPVNLNFDAAYTGNYGELALALWEVIKANRFLSDARISAMLKSRLKAKTAGTPASSDQ